MKSMNTALYLSSTLRQIESRHRDEPLMQRAGIAAAAWAIELVSDDGLPVLVLAGPGNNGGDAFEVARLLRQRFLTVYLVFSGQVNRLPDDAATAFQRFSSAGGTLLEQIPEQQRWGLIVDGLFGIGLSRPPSGRHAALIESANRLQRRDNCPLLALDCPSGLNADTGQVFEPAIEATHTITFISGKPGLLTAAGPDHCGEIRVANIGIDPSINFPPTARQLARMHFAGCLKPRRKDSHKGSFGSAGILGGAHSMVGAALLSGRAALKLGAGRVYLGLLDSTAPACDLQQPELMLRTGKDLLLTELAALACGPGLGMSLQAGELLEAAISLDQPLVLDADALNLIAREGNLQVALASRSNPAILTPHPAEAARLLACSTEAVQAARLDAACGLAERYRCHVALKGCGTVIAAVDGRFWINSTGNPGMATAGMGDVLTGLIVALLAQGWPALEALLAGVHLHGAAADRLLAQGCGPIGMTAGETIAPARQLFNEWVDTGRAY